MATYTRVETTGRVEAVNPDGIKIAGDWWNQSRRVPANLTRFKPGDIVFVEGDETPDGARRWISAIDLADGYQRPPVQPQAARAADTPVYDYDPDDLPDSPKRPASRLPQAPPQPDSLKGDRLACLQVAAGVLMPWWVKKGVDPDRALLIGFAEDLVDYLHQPRAARP